MILTYLHGPIAEVFPHCFLSFSILAIFREKRVVKVGLKVKTFGQFLFYENSNPLNFFQTMLLLARVLPLTISGGIRVKILPKRAILWMLNRYAKL